MKTTFFLIASFVTGIHSMCFAANPIVFEEDHSLPVVYINIALNAGSANDPQNKLGLTNLASQMLLRGTHSKDKLAFFEELNQLGAQLEVEVRNEGTIFKGAVLAANLKPFLELVEETLTKPKFTAGELIKLKKEVESQILIQKSRDQQLAGYHFLRFFYGAHPYGNPITGTRRGVESVTSKDISDFYSENFGANTLRLFATGAAQKDVLETWFIKFCDKLGAIHPEAKILPTVQTPQLIEGRRALIVDKPKTTQTQVYFGATGLRPENPAFYPFQLANFALGAGSFQSRLMQELRVKRGWTYGASSLMRYGRESKHFVMYLFPKTDDTAPAVELTLKIFDEFLTNGITREEFDMARASLVKGAPFEYDTAQKRIENATNEYLMNFPEQFQKNFANNIERVKFDEIAPAMRAQFNSSKLVLSILGDASKLKLGIGKIPGFEHVLVKNYLED